jgi:hypothetical protein
MVSANQATRRNTSNSRADPLIMDKEGDVSRRPAPRSSAPRSSSWSQLRQIGSDRLGAGLCRVLARRHRPAGLAGEPQDSRLRFKGEICQRSAVRVVRPRVWLGAVWRSSNGKPAINGHVRCGAILIFSAELSRTCGGARAATSHHFSPPQCVSQTEKCRPHFWIFSPVPVRPFPGKILLLKTARPLTPCGLENCSEAQYGAIFLLT